MNADESRIGGLIESSLKYGESLAISAQYGLRNISNAIVSWQEGGMSETKLIEYEKQELDAARTNRLRATMLALTASTRLTKSTVDPQQFTAGRSGEYLVHPLLENHYQMCALVEALAKEEVSVEDFAVACGIEKEYYQDYLKKDGSVTPKPNEAEHRGLWRAEIATTITELDTYQRASAIILTKAEK